jgi:hypothetical protein
VRLAATIDVVVAPRRPGEALHNFLHNPRLGPLTRGIVGDFFETVWRGERSAQLKMSRFLAESALVADQKTVAPDTRRFAQGQTLRILTGPR